MRRKNKMKIRKTIIFIFFVAVVLLLSTFDINTAYANYIPITYINEPTNNQKLPYQDVLVRGWALNATGIKEVQVSVNGDYAGNAELGFSRPDIDRKYPGYPGGAQSGFMYTIDANTLKSGFNTITVNAIGNDGTVRSRNANIEIVKPQPITYINEPTNNQKLPYQDVLVRGWALNATGIKEVQVSVNGDYAGNAELGFSRPDIDRKYPGYPGGAQSGFMYTIDANTLKSGFNTITVNAFGNDGTVRSRNANIEIVKPQPITYINEPTNNQKLPYQDVLVRGWALNATGIKEVQVSVNGDYAGNAELGFSRPDIDRKYPGYPGGAQSGFMYTIDANTLKSGFNTITVNAIGNDGTVRSRNANIEIVKPQPITYINEPTNNQKLPYQDVLVRGWALNATGIKEVQVSVNGDYTGNAELGFSRPDIDRKYPGYPGGAQSGFMYTIDANTLKSGFNTITVNAFGNDGTVRSRNANIEIVKPQPITYINEPTDNQKLPYQDVLVRGWALNATGIKEVQVSVNGDYAGNAELGFSRPDIDRKYPGYPGGAQSGFMYTIDANTLKSGFNTITVNAIGNDGTVQDRQVRVYVPEVLYKNTYYNFTLSNIVDIQMNNNPQTDLYGGGWKTAKREDVERYANPQNYLHFTPLNDIGNAKTLQITASSLNVRSGPGTTYNVLTSVSRSQIYAIQEKSNGWYKITTDIATGWVYGDYVVLIGNKQPMPEKTDTIQITASCLRVRSTPVDGETLDLVYSGEIYEYQSISPEGWYKITTRNGYTGWVSNDYAVQVSSIPNEMYQFLILSGSTGISSNELDKELNGKGILDGMGQVFWNAAKDNNINEIYLLSHALLETGNGASDLAKGVLVSVVDGKAVTPMVVYNMFGIGARDEDPIRLGSEYAYKQGWFTPEAAIIGGTKWIAESYINNPSYRQDTLYKMRWNPAFPGEHQYATDIGWAIKQTRNTDLMLEIYQRNNVPLRFDIPIYN
jgi:beta-N-acetylglucosaminidase